MGIQIKDLVTAKVTNAEHADEASKVEWTNVSNRPELAKVATSGSYNDLTNLPSHLPLSGGTLTGKLSIQVAGWNGQLALTRPSNGSNWGPAISFYDENGGRGALMMENNKLFVSDVGGTTSLRKEVSLVGHTHTKDSISDFAHTHEYLPLIGGTLANTSTASNTPLTVKGTASSNDVWIAYHNNNGFLASIGVDSSRNFRFYNGTSYKVWHEGNDGAGSGLDADKLDGYDANSFAFAAHEHDAFTGASSSADGTAGFVPAPTAGQQSYYLKGNGTWASVSNTIPSAYCSTAANTAAKTASCSGYVLTNNSYTHIIFTKANTSKTALTLNINSKGAKAIYINGAASSTSNYTLPAGTYIAYYTDSKYYINTDGTIPGTIEKSLNSNKLENKTAAEVAALSNTAGTTEKASTKLFLTGATAQGSAQTTYSNAKCYIGTNNCLYSNNKQVSTTDHTHSYLSTTLNNIEFNTTGSLPQYGGFIDFHYHKKDTSDSDKVKPTDANGNFVSTTPDYTSRIIEDAPGQISVNNAKFKIDANGKTNVTANFFHGLADNAIDADKLDGKHASDFAASGHTHDDRIFVTLVPTGTAIPANADLKTTEYLKVGRYYCSATANACTLKNCPVDQAFMMEVYSPLSTTLDTETTAKWVYRLRKITHYYTGVQYWQYVGSSSTPGEFSYGGWYALPQVAVTLDSSDTNGSSLAKGNATKPVYIDSSGRFVECNSYPAIPTSLPANGGNADTVDNKHAADFALVGHSTPVFTGATSSADGTGGHVPTPGAGKHNSFLAGDGTWKTLGLRNSSTPGKFYLQLNGTDTYNVTVKLPSDPIFAGSDAGWVPGGSGGDSSLCLRGDGTWGPVGTVGGGSTAGDGDTKNTTGSTNSTSKLFIVGAPSQATNPITYSNVNCYVQDGSLYANALYSNGTAVSTSGHTHSFSNITAGTATIGDATNSIILRSTESWRGGLYYHSAGDESMVFANVNNRSGWIFGYADPQARPNWQEFDGTTRVVPSMQIRNQCVTINKFMGNKGAAHTWSYNLDVGGSANATTLYENGTQVSVKGHTHSYSNGTAASNGAHSHSLSGSMGSAGAHTHTVTGTVASNGAHTHTVTGTVASNGAHTHTVTGTVASNGAHTHTVTGTVASNGAHTHTVTGSANSNGAHTHTVTGTVASNGAHTHTVTAAGTGTIYGTLGGTCLTICVTFAGTEVTSSEVAAHGHTFSNGSAASNGAHDHTFSNGSAASAGGHTHGLSSVTAASAGAHTHTVSGTTAGA